MKFRKIALLMALVMCLSLFAACGEKKNASDSDIKEEVEETEKPEETVNPDDLTDGQDAPEVIDYAPSFESFPKEQVMFTVDGIDVTWEELFYWYNYDIMNLQNYGFVVNDWNEASPFGEDMTYAQFLFENGEGMMTSYGALEANAKKLGISLDEEDEELIAKSWEDSVEAYGKGDEQVLIDMLATGYMSKDLFLKLNELNLLISKVQTELYGEAGEKITNEEAIDLGTQAGYFRSVHILVATTDEEGNPMDETAKAEALKKAEGIQTELMALAGDGTALMAKYDELSPENNDDQGSAMNPNGYFATSGQLVPEYEAAALTLDEYGVSEVTESTFGYHVIIRLPLDFAREGEAQDLKQACTSFAMNKLTYEWTGEAVVEKTEAYENMDLAEILSKATK